MIAILVAHLPSPETIKALLFAIAIMVAISCLLVLYVPRRPTDRGGPY